MDTIKKSDRSLTDDKFGAYQSMFFKIIIDINAKCAPDNRRIFKSFHTRSTPFGANFVNGICKAAPASSVALTQKWEDRLRVLPLSFNPQFLLSCEFRPMPAPYSEASGRAFRSIQSRLLAPIFFLLVNLNPHYAPFP